MNYIWFLSVSKYNHDIHSQLFTVESFEVQSYRTYELEPYRSFELFDTCLAHGKDNLLSDNVPMGHVNCNY
jgi:hypothetical protein